ncbi:hypothetical protein LR48_Vigan08g089300 [Vigna angularis]|uniref:Uncharacterized protein n=1 Tax=Phaseolus angularis TaxID=3914 RepID=A0A0L9V4Y2_PHAAN|nr:hypothetical protein LR48_Vigan08g089300 [Vigna angularis]
MGEAAREAHAPERDRTESARDDASRRICGSDHRGWVALFEAHRTPNFAGEKAATAEATAADGGGGDGRSGDGSNDSGWLQTLTCSGYHMHSAFSLTGDDTLFG